MKILYKLEKVKIKDDFGNVEEKLIEREMVKIKRIIPTSNKEVQNLFGSDFDAQFKTVTRETLKTLDKLKDKKTGKIYEVKEILAYDNSYNWLFLKEVM